MLRSADAERAETAKKGGKADPVPQGYADSRPSNNGKLPPHFTFGRRPRGFGPPSHKGADVSMGTVYKRILLKLSGEALAGPKGFGLD